MKIDMSYFKSYKYKGRFASGFPALLAFSLIGCDGGMIGTGSGPKGPIYEPNGPIYELENLPKRISPDLPKTLLNGEELTPPASPEHNRIEPRISPRNSDSDSGKSYGWIELTRELNRVAETRLLIEINATIVDLAFDEILNECAEQLLDCTIPADRIRVTMTQDVVNRLLKLVVEWAESRLSYSADSNISDDGVIFGPVNVTLHDNSESVEVEKANFASLLNKEVVLGETHYSQLDGAPYNHAIRTIIKHQGGEYNLVEWTDVDFSASWHEDKHVAKFTGTEFNGDTWNYFYQNNVPGELVVSNLLIVDAFGKSEEHYAKLLNNDPGQAGILVEVVAKDFLGVWGVVSTDGATAGTTTEGDTDGFSDTSDTTTSGNVAEGETGGFSDTSGTTTSGTVSAGIIDEASDNPNLIVETANRVIVGRIDNRGGYSSQVDRVFDLSKTPKTIRIEGLRESYDQTGRLLAAEVCNIDAPFQPITDCDENGGFQSVGPEGSSITDSVHYFTPEQFDSLVAMQDAIRWTVEGVPSETIHFAVVSAESQSNLSESEVLCRGVQYVAEEVRVFCTVTDEQLDNTVVVEQVDGIPTRIITEAKLVQIQ